MKYSYSPVLSTLATATVIIACGTVQSFTRFPFRILECIAGYAIGYFVNYFLVPPEDRYQKTKQSLVKCSEILVMDGTSPAYRKAKNTLDSDFQLLTEDSEHGLKKYHHEKKELLMLHAFKKILEAIEAYQDHLKHYQPKINADYSKQLHKEFHTTWDYYMVLLHHYFNKNDLDLEPQEEFLSSPELNPSSDEEVLLASDIIDFRERLRTLICDIASKYEYFADNE